ncbi:hypothetical protein HMPREF9080_00764 [Cardiobacterium valvarum F0432]|uniref:Uncharacterized protein n=1 Tax=Cardiobacterium valvarum F0432 TaxID=797473 RepID=G9ZDD1_9GAMM|nr:hypothetical protein HMPREF9080_00764 [Cardiobacterium valvarum F0432]
MGVSLCYKKSGGGHRSSFRDNGQAARGATLEKHQDGNGGMNQIQYTNPQPIQRNKGIKKRNSEVIKMGGKGIPMPNNRKGRCKIQIAIAKRKSIVKNIK